MRRLAASAVFAALLMAQSAAARQPAEPPAAAPPEPAPAMTVERKAGCGLALVAVQKGMTRYPAALARLSADRRRLAGLMLQGLGAQGEAMLDEAFAEGGLRGMAPSQVYARGVDDMLGLFEGLNPRQRSSGEAVLQRFATRCGVGLPPGLT